MWKGALVGALALTVGMVSLASAEPRMPTRGSYEVASLAIPQVTEAHIARLRRTLNLTADQVAYWQPVESALRALAREQRSEQSAGIVRSMSDRAVAMAGTFNKMRRLASAARPLIRALDDTQKRDAMMLVRHFGFDSLVASF
jgi:hypothetical protein